jgi:hypothetical protein
MEQTQCSEMSAIKHHTLQNNPKDYTQHSEHSDSLKSRIIYFIFSGTAAQHRLWPPHLQGFVITHDAPQSVGLLWTSDQLVAETST